MTTMTRDEKEAFEAAPHTIHVMNGKGDLRIMWDPADPVTTAIAQKTFDEARAEKFRGFHVGPNGEQTGLPITEFDKDMAKLIMVPANKGG